jgi:uncharacterized phage-associated protein
VATALSVAQELVRLSLSEPEPDPLTNLRLQKLLYYAQAWSLMVRGSELFPEDMEARRHGPVVPDVYRHFAEGSSSAIVAAERVTESDLSDDEREFVGRVWEAYKRYSAVRLAEMMHDETPWRKAWDGRPAPIPIEAIEEFFATQAAPDAIAAYRDRLRELTEEAARRLAQIPPLDVERLRAAKSGS